MKYSVIFLCTLIDYSSSFSNFTSDKYLFKLDSIIFGQITNTGVNDSKTINKNINMYNRALYVLKEKIVNNESNVIPMAVNMYERGKPKFLQKVDRYDKLENVTDKFLQLFDWTSFDTKLTSIYFEHTQDLWDSFKTEYENYMNISILDLNKSNLTFETSTFNEIHD